MTHIYWTRLNESPLPALPESVGSEAQRIFEKASRALLEERVRKDPTYQADYDLCTQNLQALRIGQFHYWSKACALDDDWQKPYQRFAGTPFDFSHNRSVNYPVRCPQAPEAVSDPAVWKYELLPEQYLGLIFTDWDQDGDDDIAILLASGRYVFFRRESCEPLFS